MSVHNLFKEEIEAQPWPTKSFELKTYLRPTDGYPIREIALESNNIWVVFCNSSTAPVVNRKMIQDYEDEEESVNPEDFGNAGDRGYNIFSQAFDQGERTHLINVCENEHTEFGFFVIGSTNRKNFTIISAVAFRLHHSEETEIPTYVYYLVTDDHIKMKNLIPAFEGQLSGDDCFKANGLGTKLLQMLQLYCIYKVDHCQLGLFAYGPNIKYYERLLFRQAQMDHEEIIQCAKEQSLGIKKSPNLDKEEKYMLYDAVEVIATDKISIHGPLRRSKNLRFPDENAVIHTKDISANPWAELAVSLFEEQTWNMIQKCKVPMYELDKVKIEEVEQDEQEIRENALAQFKTHAWAIYLHKKDKLAALNLNLIFKKVSIMKIELTAIYSKILTVFFQIQMFTRVVKEYKENLNLPLTDLENKHAYRLLFDEFVLENCFAQLLTTEHGVHDIECPKSGDISDKTKKLQFGCLLCKSFVVISFGEHKAPSEILLKEYLSELLRLCFFNYHCCGSDDIIANSNVGSKRGEEFQTFIEQCTISLGKCSDIFNEQDEDLPADGTEHCRRLLSVSAAQNSEASYQELNKITNLVIDAVSDAACTVMMTIEERIQKKFENEFVNRYMKKQEEYNSRHLKTLEEPKITSIRLEKIPVKESAAEKEKKNLQRIEYAKTELEDFEFQLHLKKIMYVDLQRRRTKIYEQSAEQVVNHWLGYSKKPHEHVKIELLHPDFIFESVMSDNTRLFSENLARTWQNRPNVWNNLRESTKEKIKDYGYSLERGPDAVIEQIRHASGKQKQEGWQGLNKRGQQVDITWQWLVQDIKPIVKEWFEETINKKNFTADFPHDEWIPLPDGKRKKSDLEVKEDDGIPLALYQEEDEETCIYINVANTLFLLSDVYAFEEMKNAMEQIKAAKGKNVLKHVSKNNMNQTKQLLRILRYHIEIVDIRNVFEFDFDWPAVCKITALHCVVIWKTFIIDSSAKTTLALSKKNLDWCCGGVGQFKGVIRSFRFIPTKKKIIEKVLENKISYKVEKAKPVAEQRKRTSAEINCNSDAPLEKGQQNKKDTKKRKKCEIKIVMCRGNVK